MGEKMKTGLSKAENVFRKIALVIVGLSVIFGAVVGLILFFNVVSVILRAFGLILFALCAALFLAILFG
jgi:hypothetical protein